MKKIYLDYAAATPIDPAALKAMLPWFGIIKKPVCFVRGQVRAAGGFGNPGSLHFFGQEAMAAVDEARGKIALILGADFREILFTGSATEANNLALRGVVKRHSVQNLGPKNSKNPRLTFCSSAQLSQSKSRRGALNPRIIVSSIEHESVLETARDLEKQTVEVIYLPADKRGLIDLNKLKSALNERTILVSIMHVNNETGVIQPIEKISNIIKEFRIQNSISYPLFHTDAVQSFSYLDCDVNKLGVDLMTLSAHKIYGPKGIGALYIKNLEFRMPRPLSLCESGASGQCSGKENHQNKNSLYPIITGGGQEFGFRSGTENTPLIVGFARAVELISNSRELENKRIADLKKYFWQGLKNVYSGSRLNGDWTQNFSPYILNVFFPDYSSQDFLTKMDLAGVAVSSGAACSARSYKPSHVLSALGFSEKRIKNSVRFSFGRFTDKAELKEVLKKIKQIKI